MDHVVEIFKKFWDETGSMSSYGRIWLEVYHFTKDFIFKREAVVGTK
jgi:hypothetical protein